MTEIWKGQNWRISDKDASWISRWQDLTDIYKTDICGNIGFIYIPKCPAMEEVLMSDEKAHLIVWTSNL